LNKEDLAISTVAALILMTCLTASIGSIVPLSISMIDLNLELNDLSSIEHDETPVLEFIPLQIIDIDPDTLHLDSKGEWITCYIELPDEYDVEDINRETILLNHVVSANHTDIGDYDHDGLSDLMVKFDREKVIDILDPGDKVKLTVTLELIDERQAMGTDYIKVI
jgi:hypothetical protein